MKYEHYFDDEQYKKWLALIILILRGRGISEDKAKEIAMEAFAKFIEKIQEGKIDLDTIGNKKAYLIKIANNLLIDEFRVEARRGYFDDRPLDELISKRTNYNVLDFKMDKKVLLELAFKKLMSVKGAKLKCLVFKELLRGYPSRTIGRKWWFNTEFAVGRTYYLKEQDSFFKKIDNTVQSVKILLVTIPELEDLFPKKKKECPHLTRENIQLTANIISKEAFAVFKKAIRKGLKFLTVPESKIWYQNRKIILSHPVLGPLCKDSNLF